MKLPTLPWWRTDNYDLAGLNDGPDMARADLWGPHGPAVVPLFTHRETGEWLTGPGWGRDTFMSRYNKLEFSPRRLLYKYQEKQQAFAWVMRGARIVCIDIDGKNGGFDHAAELGYLPPTVAEISLSGNGYHLFYEVDDTWDPVEGFGKYRDIIGLVTGVDFRGTGCVFHKPAQRWNSAALAPLPDHLSTLLLQRKIRREKAAIEIAKTLELDPQEIAIMQDELLTELAKPIPAGKRNQTLFAIGSQLMLAKVPDWEDKLTGRGTQLGLPTEELEKLVRNVTNYGAK